MSDRTINLCGIFLLKSVKVHFSGNTENFGVLKKSSNFLRGSFLLLRLVRTVLAKNESEILYFEEKYDF